MRIELSFLDHLTCPKYIALLLPCSPPLQTISELHGLPPERNKQTQYASKRNNPHQPTAFTGIFYG